MRSVGPPPSALHLVDRQGPVKPPPQVAMLDLDTLAESLPGPIVIAPRGKTLVNPLLDIPAGRNQRHSRRLIERLETADHRQQVEPVTEYVRLEIGDFRFLASIEGPHDETPPARSLPAASIGNQQVMGTGSLRDHRQARSGGTDGVGPTRQPPRATPTGSGFGLDSAMIGYRQSPRRFTSLTCCSILSRARSWHEKSQTASAKRLLTSAES